MTSDFWETVTGRNLLQGDVLEECEFPLVVEDSKSDGSDWEIDIGISRLIVITQSCDLESERVEFVALCPVSLAVEFGERNGSSFEFDASAPSQSSRNVKGNWEGLRKGRQPGCHLLPPYQDADNPWGSLVVEFGQIISLPYARVADHAASLGDRPRLRSPYLEHLSQAFARYFMRVGLPTQIQPFK